MSDTGSSLSAVEFWSCVALVAVMHGGLGSIVWHVLRGLIGMWNVAGVVSSVLRLPLSCEWIVKLISESVLFGCVSL